MPAESMLISAECMLLSVVEPMHELSGQCCACAVLSLTMCGHVVGQCDV